MRKIVFLVLLFTLGACSSLPQTDVVRKDSSAGVLFADATKKAVYVYPPEGSKAKSFSVCVDPSPDAGANLKAALDLAAKADVKGAGGELDLSSELRQDIVQLVARSQGLQLQRDILTQACLARQSGYISNQEYMNLFSESMSASTALIVAEMLTTKDSRDLTDEQLNMLLNFLLGSTYSVE